MPAVIPHQDAGANAPVSHPTHPVAGQGVEWPSPTFDWTPLPHAEAYRLQLAPTDAFADPWYEETVTRPASVDLKAVLPDAASTVYWRVRPEDGGERTRWSEGAQFVIGGGEDGEETAVVVDAEPVPVHPSSDAAVDADAATFAWEGVPAASGYQIQVSPDAGGEDLLLDFTVDQVTSITLYGVLPEEGAPLHWRVRSLFRRGGTGPWSPVISFATSPEQSDEDPSAGGELRDEATGDEAEKMGVVGGRAQDGRTGRVGSIGFILLVVIGFLLAVLLVAWMG